MSFSFAESIIPLSDIRTDLDKIMKKIKHSSVVITNKGRPHFGICNLEVLEIAQRIYERRELLNQREKSNNFIDIDEAFDILDKEFGFK